MKATLNVSVQDDQILVNSPEMGYHESLPNVLLIDRSRNMLMGVGVTLADVQSRSPEAWEAKKDVLYEVPAFSNIEFQPLMTNLTCMFFDGCVIVRAPYKFLPFGLGRIYMTWNLQLKGYEQIPQGGHEQFEYEALTNSNNRRGKVKKLVINGCHVTQLNSELVRKGRKFRWQQALSNLLIGTFSLLAILSLLALLSYVIGYVFPFRTWLAEINTHILPIAGLLVLVFCLLVLIAFVGEIIGTAGAFALLRLFLPQETLLNIAKNQTYISQRVKQMVVKFLDKYSGSTDQQ